MHAGMGFQPPLDLTIAVKRDIAHSVSGNTGG